MGLAGANGGGAMGGGGRNGGGGERTLDRNIAPPFCEDRCSPPLYDAITNTYLRSIFLPLDDY